MKTKEDLSRELNNLFFKLVKRFVIARDSISYEGTVSMPQYGVLRTLAATGPLKIGELARLQDFSPGAMSSFCSKLVKEGFVIRHYPEEDRRTVYVKLTPQGEMFVRKHSEARSSIETLLFADMSEEEIQRQLLLFTQLMDKLPEHFEAMQQILNRER